MIVFWKTGKHYNKKGKIVVKYFLTLFSKTYSPLTLPKTSPGFDVSAVED